MANTYEKTPWRTAIANVKGDDIYLRGYHFLELAEKVDFASVLYLMYKGELPNKGQARMLNALLVTMIDHGIAPSEAVSRVVAASGSPIQAAIAAGILTIGDIHGGAGEACARMYQERLSKGKNQGKSIPQIAEELVAERRKAKQLIEGYGHPMHPSGDPRGPWLLNMADQCGVSGEYAALARAIEGALAKAAGRRIGINIDGGSAAILCDLGLDWRLARPILITARSVGLAAHAWEEMTRERGWRIVAAEDDVLYDGVPERKLR
ncbi:MAG: citryl-CoA lyase [Chloroflexota bacterium]|nr:citryl-CoA lyase [Chloroflexota bacterium]